MRDKSTMRVKDRKLSQKLFKNCSSNIISPKKNIYRHEN